MDTLKDVTKNMFDLMRNARDIDQGEAKVRTTAANAIISAARIQVAGAKLPNVKETVPMLGVE